MDNETFLKFEAMTATKASLAVQLVGQGFSNEASRNAEKFLAEYFKLPESPTPNAPTGDTPAS